MTELKFVVAAAMWLVAAPLVDADECRDLAKAKHARVLVIRDSAGPVYGYAELADPLQAWESTRKNWTKTVQGTTTADVRAQLAKRMRVKVICNPNPPRIAESGLFGDYVDWGELDDRRRSIYNVNDWAPPAPPGYWKTNWKRTWSVPATRD